MSRMFKEWVKEQNESQRLDEGQITVLLNMQKEDVPHRVHIETRRKRAWSKLASVSLLILMLGLGFWLGGYQQEWDKNTLPELIAYEVVNNHLKQKPLDIKAHHFSMLSDYFEKLSFKPIKGTQFQGDIVGGRYCSLRTLPSAQIRFKDQDGVSQTLYQTEYKEAYFSGLPEIGKGEMPIIESAKGVDVSIWIEKGIVFVKTLDK